MDLDFFLGDSSFAHSMPNHRQPESLQNDETQLNQTYDSIMSNSSMTMTHSVKRTPSLNDAHYMKRPGTKKVSLDTSLNTQLVYENVSAQSSSSTLTTVVATESMSTQTEAKSPLQMQREGSFVRTGSGRKLPKIPDNPPKQQSEVQQQQQRRPSRKDSIDSVHNKSENRKSKPKALEFWENLETVDGGDFKYNTIHRMSTGRRMLPKPPPGETGDDQMSVITKAVQRSQSLDRNGERAAAVASLAKEEDMEDEPNLSDIEVDEKGSINSCFSLPLSHNTKRVKDEEESVQSAPLSHPSPPSSESRGNGRRFYK